MDRNMCTQISLHRFPDTGVTPSLITLRLKQRKGFSLFSFNKNCTDRCGEHYFLLYLPEEVWYFIVSRLLPGEKNIRATPSPRREFWTKVSKEGRQQSIIKRWHQSHDVWLQQASDVGYRGCSADCPINMKMLHFMPICLSGPVYWQ